MQPSKQPVPNLEYLGLLPKAKVHWNLNTMKLYEEALARHEAVLTADQSLIVHTPPHYGRLPHDKFFVDDETTRDSILWGDVNRPFEPAKAERLFLKVIRALEVKDCFIQDCFIGAEKEFRIPIRVISETATGALFAHTMLLHEHSQGSFDPEFTLIHMPSYACSSEEDGTNSDAIILIDFTTKKILITGTRYQGEIKKAFFTIMNFLLPFKDVLPMHCSANYGESKEDVAIFFGLSGTGKTTLSASPERTLIGDDEHGWSDKGVFNFEGGCYAKTINLTREREPEIFQATKQFGAILENVLMNEETKEIDFSNTSLTENTRVAYPISHIPHMDLTGKGGHPKHVIMLTCDAFGIFPPVGKLTEEQAMYHFLMGYTAKVAGTEAGVSEPEATFSACFGAPFMPLAPSRYAKLLGEKIRKHQVDVWMINTGWAGGAYGHGRRMDLKITRTIVRHVLNGALSREEFTDGGIWGFKVPRSCPGVPEKILNPKFAWPSVQEYETNAKRLAVMFQEHFTKNFKERAAWLEEAGPRL